MRCSAPGGASSLTRLEQNADLNWEKILQLAATAPARTTALQVLLKRLHKEDAATKVGGAFATAQSGAQTDAQTDAQSERSPCAE